MAYPRVRRSHVVPRSYLKQWADEDDLIGARLVGSAESKTIGLDNAGVRKDFYERTRPDGTTIHDVEWSLSEVEAKAAPLLRSLAESWPPESVESKAALAAFFALLMVRGPRWKDWHEQFTKGFVEEKRVEGTSSPGLRAVHVHSALDAAVADEFERHLLDQRFIRMLSLARKITGLVGSMHWALLEFGSPLVATSDHPIVLWPLDVAARPPEPTPMSAGLFETLEIRAPVSPFAAILMTWANLRDGEHDRLKGHRHHAASLNAFTVAEAERQWFHVPGRRPPVGAGRFLPLSRELLPGYGEGVVGTSQRRAAISAKIQPKVGIPYGQEFRETELEMVRLP